MAIFYVPNYWLLLLIPCSQYFLLQKKIGQNKSVGIKDNSTFKVKIVYKLNRNSKTCLVCFGLKWIYPGGNLYGVECLQKTIPHDLLFDT